MQGAMTPTEISNALGLSALKNRTWAIFKTSALKGDGLQDAMEWLVCLPYYLNYCTPFLTSIQAYQYSTEQNITTSSPDHLFWYIHLICLFPFFAVIKQNALYKMTHVWQIINSFEVEITTPNIYNNYTYTKVLLTFNMTSYICPTLESLQRGCPWLWGVVCCWPAVPFEEQQWWAIVGTGH